MAEETERIYVIPLKKKGIVHSKAASSAMKRVKQYLQKHMKVAESDIWIDDSLNHALWNHGKYYVPTKIRVKAVRFEDGVVEAYLPELEFTKSRREILQEERSKKTPILRKEEPMEESEEETGAEDYDVVPGPDGEVKIKKKKTKKEEEESEEETEGKEEPVSELESEETEEPEKETEKTVSATSESKKASKETPVEEEEPSKEPVKEKKTASRDSKEKEKKKEAQEKKQDASAKKKDKES